MNDDVGPDPCSLEPHRFVRVPGLLRRWEIESVLEPGVELHVEAAGEAEDGTALFAVYRREPDRDEG